MSEKKMQKVLQLLEEAGHRDLAPASPHRSAGSLLLWQPEVWQQQWRLASLSEERGGEPCRHDIAFRALHVSGVDNDIAMLCLVHNGDSMGWSRMRIE
ncbi:hypothetical protein NDU88_001699 [Pleurodeles waltl]|uniref:Uncharacterized protein n=1 Tax=Pleurodeles waltl TaxID=8319 RepID=A0AAV7UXH1_PLEWA|nr:hypothetical protein NDU88_001699 [Pleurodeles waltl]